MKQVALGELCDIRSGGTPSRSSPEFYGGGIPWAKISDIEAADGLLVSTEETITDEGLAAIRGRMFDVGTLLFAIYGSIGKMAFVGRPLATNQAILGIWNVHPDVLSSRYMFRYLESRRDTLLADGAGIAQKNLSAGYVRDLKIPLPPFEEQRRIAGILDQADALRRLRTRAQEKLNTLGQAIFHEMFGNPQSNPKGWDVKALPDLGRLDRGVSKHRPRNDPSLLGGDHPLIQTGDVARAGDYITSYAATYSDLGLAQSRMWRRGTVCITIAANIADTAILGFDACFPDSVVGFDSGNDATNFFVHRWFATVKGHLEEIAPAVAQKNINLGILRSLPIISPPIDLIEAYFEKEKIASASTAVLLQHAGTAKALFTSLQHRAFRGEL